MLRPIPFQRRATMRSSAGIQPAGSRSIPAPGSQNWTQLGTAPETATSRSAAVPAAAGGKPPGRAQEQGTAVGKRNRCGWGSRAPRAGASCAPKTRLFHHAARLVITICFVTPIVQAEDAQPSSLPPAAARPIDFATDIQPILEQNCLRCHNANRAKGGFRLDNPTSTWRGGDSGPALVFGDSSNSLLIHYVAQLDPDNVMPPPDQGQPLTTEQVSLLRAWIDQGAWWSNTATNDFNFSLAPAIGFVSVQGNEGRFAEHHGQREGWRGGVESFSLSEQLSPDSRFTLSGRAITDDYRVDLLVGKTDARLLPLRLRANALLRRRHRRLFPGLLAAHLEFESRPAARRWPRLAGLRPHAPRLAAPRPGLRIPVPPRREIHVAMGRGRRRREHAEHFSHLQIRGRTNAHFEVRHRTQPRRLATLRQLSRRMVQQRHAPRKTSPACASTPRTLWSATA